MKWNPLKCKIYYLILSLFTLLTQIIHRIEFRWIEEFPKLLYESKRTSQIIIFATENALFVQHPILFGHVFNIVWGKLSVCVCSFPNCMWLLCYYLPVGTISLAPLMWLLILSKCSIEQKPAITVLRSTLFVSECVIYLYTHTFNVYSHIR